ncbi:MAG TPA: arylsulfotransferase family protein [Chitinophagaceae bacterium]|nr:arylsulfotransferase family protein [Chitinophagaceae bacterium]
MKWSKLLDKKINVRYFLLLMICFVGLSVLLLGALRHQYLGGKKMGKWGYYLKNIAEYPALVYHSLNLILGYDLPLINKKYVPNGFTYFYKQFTDTGFILESVYDKNIQQYIIKLIAVENGQTIYTWTPLLATLHLSKKSQVVHPHLSKDGTVVFSTGWDGGETFEYIVKIDSLSKLVWSKRILPHHSIETDAEGNIWVPTVIKEQNIVYTQLPIGKNIQNEAITQISIDGKILFQKSVLQILLENGYSALLLGIGIVDEDLAHLNEVRPALYSSPYWQKGDLLISLRHKSTVFLYRPSTNKITWLQTGPWMNQHCPDFLDSNKISVFGNDIIRGEGGDYLLHGSNDIYIHDFATHTTITPYSNMMRELGVRTPTQGRLKIFPNGDVFIDESDSGRTIRANKNGPIWIFENRYDKNHIALTIWNRYLVKNGDCKFCLTENLK